MPHIRKHLGNCTSEQANVQPCCSLRCCRAVGPTLQRAAARLTRSPARCLVKYGTESRVSSYRARDSTSRQREWANKGNYEYYLLAYFVIHCCIYLRFLVWTAYWLAARHSRGKAHLRGETRISAKAFQL